MISRISGKLAEKKINSLRIELGGISYEILVPEAVMQRIDENLDENGCLSLVTFHYHQVDQSKSIPVLIGFLNEIEKDFFEIFITVSGIGPRAALKAFSKPMSQIARAIDQADVAFLKSLPGIGEQRAKEVIAKLQNKVARFGLIRDSRAVRQEKQVKDISEEAMQVLLRLQYKKSEAADMVKKAISSNPDIGSSEELLNAVYRQERG